MEQVDMIKVCNLFDGFKAIKIGTLLFVLFDCSLRHKDDGRVNGIAKGLIRFVARIALENLLFNFVNFFCKKQDKTTSC